ncbi:MAG: DsbA family oxidoreductase [Pyramidobacter sp.]|jgi:predicted DsbA family dithiol-disulfide isomerase
MDKNGKKHHITMFLDVICEWCYLAKGILDSLHDRYDFDVTLLFMEIHPDAPVGGMPMSWHIADPGKFFNLLRAAGAPYGIHFCDRDVFSNTRKALLVAEYAKSIGKGESFLRAIWKAYMEEGKNISEDAVVQEAALAAGLGPRALELAWNTPAWGQHLKENAELNDRCGMNGNVPGFVIDGKYTLSGAQSAHVWEEILQKIEAAEAPSVESSNDEAK